MQTSPSPKKTAVSKWVLEESLPQFTFPVFVGTSLGRQRALQLSDLDYRSLTLDKQGLKLSLFAVPLPCGCAVRAEGSNTRSALWYLVIYPVCVSTFGHQCCDGRVGLFLVFSHTTFTLKSGERKESWEVYWRRWILNLLLKNEID